MDTNGRYTDYQQNQTGQGQDQQGLNQDQQGLNQDRQTRFDQAAAGQSAYGQSAYGNDAYQQNPYGQDRAEGSQNYTNSCYQQNGYSQNGYQQNAYGQNTYQSSAPAKKKKGAFGKTVVALLIVLALAGCSVLGIWSFKNLNSNIHLSINGKTIIGEEAKTEDESSKTDRFEDDREESGSKETDAGKDSEKMDADHQDREDGKKSESKDKDDDKQVKNAETVTGSVMAVVTDVTEVVKNTMPCLVSVNNTYVSKMNYFGQVYEQKGVSEGSGIIVGQNETELLIVSNNHVVANAEELSISFVDESQVPGYVKGTDSDRDLAIIAVLLEDIPSETMDAIAIAEMGDSDELTVGEPVVAIGNSLGYGQSVTTGVVSALNRPIGADTQTQQSDATATAGDVEVATFIQTDAAINPGNSGGALLNINGQVIGINSNKIGGDAVEGMGYAIPISDAKPIIEELMSQETKIKVSDEDRGYLGITGVNVEKQYAVMYGMPEGVYISSVTEGTGAAQAGLAKGDIIVGLGEKGIESMDELKAELAYHKAGEVVTITIMRSNNGEYVSQEVQVTLTGA